MRAVTLLSALLLAACSRENAVRPPPPAKVITVYVPTYVKIPPELTAPCEWLKDTNPSRVFEAANSRRRCLEETYEPNLRAIRGIEGSPVPDEASP